ncbi:MAG: type IV pilus twitching motility protein PilT [Planctomycetota bacterium]|nr:type IV pilus twitching motility protein PilT [Planctomycetota bacterium]
MGLEDLLQFVVDRNASDLHIKATSPVRMRVDGKLVPLGDRPLTTKDVDSIIGQLLTQEQLDRFLEDNDLDMAYSLPGAARFRINVLRARGEPGLAIRRIPEIVPSAEELGISPVCLEVAERPRGLVLVTGPTGSGKSTTLAAMIQHINRTRRCHIVTMEDPIEYIHREDQAHITQREMGRDTADFASALRRALRQDPDVILVGEMRDLETISLAVTAAETGHLVFGTLHTTSAVLSVDRVVDVFPPAQQRQIRMQLADALQAIFSQTLLPRIGRGVVCAQEILVATGGIRALIREGKSPQIGNMMQTGSKVGMQTLEDALNDLIGRKLISFETAVSKANHPAAIKEDGTVLRS